MSLIVVQKSCFVALCGVPVPHVRVRVLEVANRFGQTSIEDVSASAGDDFPLDTKSTKSQIANQIQQLVPGAFVFKSEGVIYRAVRSENNQVAIGYMRSHPLHLQVTGIMFG